MLIRQGKSEAEAAATLKVLLVGEGDLVDSVVRFRHQIAEQRRTIAINQALFDPEEEGEPWYGGPREFDVFWPDLRAALEVDPSWVDAVPSLDEASTDIVGLLANPHSPSIRTRGLVLGFVQSGKTANFTASIAKGGRRRVPPLHRALRRSQLAPPADAIAHRRTARRTSSHAMGVSDR